jgi:hypothetical protein
MKNLLKKIADYRLQIITLTIISLVVTFITYVAIKTEKHRKDYPYVIRHGCKKWRSAIMPEQWADGWVTFTDDRGNEVAIRGEITIITENKENGAYQ